MGHDAPELLGFRMKQAIHIIHGTEYFQLISSSPARRTPILGKAHSRLSGQRPSLHL